MAKFVYLYVGGSDEGGDNDAVMAAWISWFGELGDAVVDGGNPFSSSSSIAANGKVSSGNVTGATGYSIVNAANLDAAVKMANGCPIFAAGGGVDVLEAMDM